MKTHNPYVSFTWIASLVHEMSIDPALKRTIANRLADVLTQRYPDFTRDRFLGLCITGQEEQASRPRKRRRAATLSMGQQSFLEVSA